jgi:hypothetical protein
VPSQCFGRVGESYSPIPFCCSKKWTFIAHNSSPITLATLPFKGSTSDLWSEGRDLLYDGRRDITPPSYCNKFQLLAHPNTFLNPRLFIREGGDSQTTKSRNYASNRRRVKTPTNTLAPHCRSKGLKQVSLVFIQTYLLVGGKRISSFLLLTLVLCFQRI